MKFLITGATGFIGRHLCRRLVDDGHTVVALLRTPGKASLLPASGVELLAGDLSLFRDEALELPPCDVVVHLAAVIAGRNEAEYHAINHRAVGDLIACLERQAWKPRRLLFASSLAAGGPSAPGAALREDDASRPVDPYGAAKLEAEALVRRASFPTTSFRPSIVLGPEDPATLTLYRMVARGVGFRAAGPPQILSTVDVVDLVDAIVKMADEQDPAHQLYYVAHDQTVTGAGLLEAMGEALGRRPLVVPLPRSLFFLAYLVATAAAKIFRFKNQLDRKQYLQITAPAFVCSAARLQERLGWL